FKHSLKNVWSVIFLPYPDLELCMLISSGVPHVIHLPKRQIETSTIRPQTMFTRLLLRFLMHSAIRAITEGIMT
ncbi:MAG: hypothetical protein MUP03_10710, partial [Anaerolineales bacterium]|nr:hypothetical protein [Anaerolineales bacterium]